MTTFRPDPKKFRPKKSPKPLKRVGLKKKFPKQTGELALYKALWLIRERKCVNCHVPLLYFKVEYFSHIKSKGARPDLRLNPANIQLLCFYCHFAFDNQGMEKFNSLSK